MSKSSQILIQEFFSKVLNNFKNSKKDFVINNGKRYSYSQAYIDVKKINFHLKNIHKKNIVIFSDKSFSYYSSVIAILFSGNKWIQVSPATPIERIKSIISISDAKYALYDDSFLNKKVLKIKGVKFLFLKDILSNDKKLELSISNYPKDEIAMIFFTSGSTGLPKGVNITYKNFISCLEHQVKNLGYKKNQEIFADYHDSTFVMSVVVIFPAIFLNCTISPLVETSDKMLPEGHLLRNNITVLITVPSFIFILNNRTEKKKIKLNVFILCGENFPLNILNIILKLFKFNYLFNCYGATELSPWAFFYKFLFKNLKIIKKMGQVPIGNPFNGLSIKFLKSKELLVSGDIVSPGYIDKDKNLNNKKFLKIRGQKFYNTGDVVIKVNNLYFCKGRNDTQIKIRGYRVDTTEIESLIKKIKNVDYAYCYPNLIGSSQYLALILVTKNDFTEQFIVNYLKKLLPSYMIPQKIIFLKKLRFNKNGKVDKAYYKNQY
jgi:acyl-CoA synthetase (AMP-forming)/AMP-acid ligase II